MLDVGWSEMLVILIVALIVIGPKELPGAIRKVTQFVRKAQGMAREFQSSLDEIGREEEFQELKRTAQSIRSTNMDDALDKLDPSGAIKDARAAADDLKQEIGKPLEDPDAAREAGEGPSTPPAATGPAPSLAAPALAATGVAAIESLPQPGTASPPAPPELAAGATAGYTPPKP